MANSDKKIISVLDKNNITIEMLKKILKLYGNDKYAAAQAGEPLPPNASQTVLLICKPCENFSADGYAVRIIDYELTGLSGLSVKKPFMTYSTDNNNADFTARNIRITPDGFVAFEIVGVGIIGRVKLNTGDTAAVNNALAAAAAAIGAGIPFADVLKALNSI